VKRPRVVVLSSCTGVKAPTDGATLGHADFARGRRYLDRRHRGDLAGSLVSAERLYRGQQHVRLMRGVHAAREAGTLDVDLRIVSAGYGVVAASDQLAPYECTFQGMPRARRRVWARQLGVPDAARRALSARSDLALVLLGDEYLDACGFDETLELGGPTLVFCGSRTALRLPVLPQLKPVHLATAHTRMFHCGLVGLKGEVGGRLLARAAEDPGSLGRVDHESLLGDLAAHGPVTETNDAGALALF
jgi:hypothetical protein